MNELIFLFHIVALMSFVMAALYFGKETLIACFSLQIILANLFVTKQMICFGLDVTCSDVYTIGAIFSLNLLQEYHGKRVANQTILTLFFLLFFFIIMSQFHLRYHPSEYDGMHQAFSAILGYTPRIMLTSVFVALLCQKLDIELFGWLKKVLPEKAFFIRFGGASLVTQFIDTALFSSIALYGLVHSIGDIIFMSYIIKVAIIFTMAPFTLLTRRLMRHELFQV
ncbi:MAG: queuosine precursor transporter [Chlamydiia bacterium]|nr:queuosine precursor transporter [Chlamydiia bacterium]